MTTDTLKRLGWFLVYLMAQVLVVGRIHLFGVATPLLYVYFVLQLPLNHPKWGTLLWGFCLGLAADIFFNTPGVGAASLTLIAALQPYYLQAFVSQDAAEDLRASFKTLGSLKYAYYAIPLILLFCTVFFTLEQFSFFHALHWLLCIVGSTLVTTALIFTFEAAKKR